MSGDHVLGDWGSTRLRLWRKSDGEICDRRDGPGIIGLDKPPADALLEALAPWLTENRPMHVTLCGMAGARGGLREAGYVDCPVSAETWARQTVEFAMSGITVRIAPGCATRRGTAASDVMRGEETQIFGAVALAPELGQGLRTIILPGTHSKWATIDDGRITALRTFMTGELFALLKSSSLLTVGAAANEEPGGFAAGIARALESPGLLGNLFTTRAAQLRDDRGSEWALEFLSGLLIGTEIAEMQAFASLPSAICLIGDPALTDRYGPALDIAGLAATSLDGEACVLAGLGLLDAHD